MIRHSAYIVYPKLYLRILGIVEMYKYNLDLSQLQLSGVGGEIQILDKHTRIIVGGFFCASSVTIMFPLVREFDRSFVPRAFIAISLFTATLPTVVLCAQHVQNHGGMTAQILRKVTLSFLVLAAAEFFVGMMCSYYGVPPGDPGTGYVYILCGCYVFSSVIYGLISLED